VLSLDIPRAATRPSRLETCEVASPSAGRPPEADVDEGVKTVRSSDVGGVKENEGDLARSAKLRSAERFAPNRNIVSIEGRASSGLTCSPRATLAEYEAFLVEGVFNRSELLESFSLCAVEL
jgi:hypothetical protein